MNAKVLLFSSLLLVPLSCTSDHPRATARDTSGNYATTSDFRSGHRSEFREAMQAGLRDFDERLRDLSSRANELGGETLEEYRDLEKDLIQEREAFANKLEKMDAALDDQWPEQREEVEAAYEDLRDSLDDAYEEVLG